MCQKYKFSAIRVNEGTIGTLDLTNNIYLEKTGVDLRKFICVFSRGDNLFSEIIELDMFVIKKCTECQINCFM